MSALLKVPNSRRWRWTAREQPLWDERNKAIAALITPGSSVLDIGAGAQTLRGLIDPSSHYQPCDIVQSSADVILCNFNAGQFPQLPRRYDVVVASGVAEYMVDLDDFIPRIATYGDLVYLSYAISFIGQTQFQRMQMGWFNHLSQFELEALLERHGLQWELCRRWGDQLVYRYRREG